MRVEDDAEERSAAGLAVGAEDVAAVGEAGVVGEDGADAGEDGVGVVAEELDLLTGGGAGEPVRLVGRAQCGGGQHAVYRSRGFERDEGDAVLDEVGEGVVEVAGGLLQDADGDFDVCGAELGDSLAADLGVGVLRGDDATGDTGGDEGVGAGAGAAEVAAGFEGDVGGGSFGGDATLGGLLEGDDLGVVAVGVEVSAFADDLGFIAIGRAGQDAAYLRIGRGKTDGVAGEVESALHEGFVLCDGGHGVRGGSRFLGYGRR